jgi:hypothetical protein
MMNRVKGRLIEAGVDIDLFHNHDIKIKQKKIGYPKIQYIRKRNLYYVSGINEGQYALEQLFIDCKPIVSIDDGLNIKIEKTDRLEHLPRLTEEFHLYNLTDWLPMSDNSDKEYEAIVSLADKDTFLEKRLTNHIVKDFFHYLKISVKTEKVEVIITKIDSYNRKQVRVKEDKHSKHFMPFSITFRTNLLLPENLCLGNKKVYGFGLIQPAP